MADLDGRAIRGPLAEYDDRVRSGRLRYDIHQRGKSLLVQRIVREADHDHK